jgi:geranylgeranyl pyrophosphate synthase
LKSLNEYLDFKGPGEEIGNGAKTWLFTKALELGNEAQKQILVENNGKVEGIEKVKEVYRELGVPRLAQEYQDKFLVELKGELDALSTGLPPIVADLVVKLVTRPSED